MASKRLRSSLSSLTLDSCLSCRHSKRPILSTIRTMSTSIETNAPGPIEAISSAPIPPELTTSAKSLVKQVAVPKTPRDLKPQPPNPFSTKVQVTLYSFPEYKPVSTTSFPGTHLSLPLRRDILHKAVIYEGDRTRQGTASTKTRYEVHGSNRKIRPQKGSGRARLGDKKSPMLRGGGVAFGPKPRDFATGLPGKMYDIALRTALSYRYKRGELIVLENTAEIPRSGPGSARWVREMLSWNGWGSGTGGSLIVTSRERPSLWSVFRSNAEGWETVRKSDGVCKTIDEVDVKNLLEGGRVIIEHSALLMLFRRHTRDLQTKALLASWRQGSKSATSQA